MRLLDDFDGGVRRVEDMAAPRMAVETDRMAPIEPMNRPLQHAHVERGKQVIVVRHQAKAVADDESVAAEFADQLHACEVVPVVTKDVLLRNRSRCHVEGAGVIRAHRPSVPASVCRVCVISVETQQPG
jgi:hypothetical protein